MVAEPPGDDLGQVLADSCLKVGLHDAGQEIASTSSLSLRTDEHQVRCAHLGQRRVELVLLGRDQQLVGVAASA